MNRLYALLLHLYPASYRMEYGGELRRVFAQQHPAPAGIVRRIAWLVAALADVVPNATAVHWGIFRQDLRYSGRGLRRSWGFALTVVHVVALGVGANTAAFSLADFVLIRPLPFPEARRLVRVNGQNDISPATYQDLKQMTKSFAGMGAFNPMSANLVGEGEPQRVEGARVSADLIGVLGVPPLLGRTFTTADDRAGTAPTVVLGYGLWMTYFGGSADVIGRAVTLDGTPHTIVGVMPPTFSFPNRQAQFWKPFQFEAANLEDRNDNWLYVIGRLRDNVTFEQARGDLDLAMLQLTRQYPREYQGANLDTYLLQDDISRQSRLLLETLCGAALCILLLACANLANLLLARGVGREREMSVRAALGAGRERLVRQMVTESALLALIGGIVGVLVAVAAIPPLTRLVPTSLPVSSQPSVDPRVLLFAGLLTALTGIGFGIIPALRAGRASALAGLRDGARSGGGRKQRARFVLVTIEVMATVVLLISSGLLVRAMLRVQGTNPGFRAAGVLTMRTQLPLPRYDSTGRRVQFYQRVLSDIRALPGVSGAAYITGLPMAMRGGIWEATIEGREVRREDAPVASARFVTPQFFATFGIPLLRGRDVDESDRIDRPFVAVVSDGFAKRLWPNEDPLGKQFQIGPAAKRIVVGVVGDIRVRGLERRSEPQVYLSYQQVEDGAIIGYIPKDLVIRSSLQPAALLPAIRRAIRAADPAQPISGVRTMDEIVADETASRVAQLRVLGALAAIALILAVVGIHGLLSFTVSQRSQEIGVRLALGALPRGIVRMVFREGVILAVAGVLPGTVLAYAAGRAMQSLLVGVKPADPLTIGVAVAVCTLMAVAGSLVPAMRAVRVHPASVMRAE